MHLSSRCCHPCCHLCIYRYLSMYLSVYQRFHSKCYPPRYPLDRITQISRYKSKLDQNFDLNVYHKIPKNLSFPVKMNFENPGQNVICACLMYASTPLCTYPSIFLSIYMCTSIHTHACTHNCKYLCIHKFSICCIVNCSAYTHVLTRKRR